jgi:hypothetical protein
MNAPAARSTSVQIGPSETIVIIPSASGVRLEIKAFGIAMASRSLTREQARQIGDALGFASNDLQGAGHAL